MMQVITRTLEIGIYKGNIFRAKAPSYWKSFHAGLYHSFSDLICLTPGTDIRLFSLFAG